MSLSATDPAGIDNASTIASVSAALSPKEV